MYKNKRVSVILPAYNEEQSIKQAINDFFAHVAVDEVVAVDNNSKDATAAEIKKTRARYIKETVQGYGSALRRGLREASGDILVTCDSDSTYLVSDLDRLLTAGEKFDTVFTSRTHRAYIRPGAAMGFARRTGDWAVGKLLQVLFWGPNLTDVGATYKLIHRAAYEKINNKLTVAGNHFSPEFILRVIQSGAKATEIPVFYLPRVGESAGGTGSSFWKTTKVGMRMIFFILRERIG